MRRTINDAGLALIKTFESLRLTAYQDSVGVWTIGYGHTFGVHANMTMTLAGANQALADDLRGMEAAVDGGVGTTVTNDNQFAAMVSLCFNVGTWNFHSSSVLSRHRAGDTQAAADAFLLWNKARIDGVLQPLLGLTRRRQAERTLYLT